MLYSSSKTYAPPTTRRSSDTGQPEIRWHWRIHPRAVASGTLPGLDSQGRRTPKLARLEAALFVAEGPLSVRKLMQHALLADAAEVRRLAETLNQTYDRDDSAFRIEKVGTGLQLLTRPRYARWLDTLHNRQSELKLSPPALETLTIVAYRQPVTRADIEAIRGVQCAEMLKQLMDRGLVRIAGEEDSLGRPFLYRTTRTFQELFGLSSLDELPMADELRRAGEEVEAEEEPDASPTPADADSATPPEDRDAA